MWLRRPTATGALCLRSGPNPQLSVTVNCCLAAIKHYGIETAFEPKQTKLPSAVAEGSCSYQYIVMVPPSDWQKRRRQSCRYSAVARTRFTSPS